MRVFCFWLMIALMPLRAWAGDAMALQMALQMSLAGAPHSSTAVAVAPEECPGHANPGVEDHAHHAHHAHHGGHTAHDAHSSQASQTSHTSHTDGSTHNCLHCDICQGKVHAVLPSVVALTGSERELPAYGGNPIDLGPAASFFKPPIV